MAILVVVVLGAVLSHGHLIEIEYRQEQLSDFEQLLHDLEPSLARSIWQTNEEAMSVILTTLNSAQNVGYAHYVDPLMNLTVGDPAIAAHMNSRCDQVILRDFENYQLLNYVVEGGLLEICFVYAPETFNLQSIFDPSLLPFYLAILSSSVIFVVFSWKLIIEPLRNLTQHISSRKDIETFERKPFFGFKETDEIDLLVDELVDRTRALADERAVIDASFPEIEDAIVQTDLAFRIVRYNSAFERMHPDVSPVVGHDLSKTYPREVLLNFKNRNEVGEIGKTYLEIVTTQIQPGNSSKGFIHVIRDLTEVKRMEQEAVQATKYKALGTMSGGIAHDYNNLIATILSNAEYLNETQKLDEKSKIALNSIIAASNSGSSLSRQLMDFASNRPPTLAFVESQDVMTKAHGMAQAVLGKGIEFEIKPRGDYCIHADEGALTNALLNLIINARDALKGQGRITLSNKIIRENDADYVAFIVEDNGPGMDQETLDKIRTPFYTTKDKGKGLGLGLAMVSNLTKQMNGLFNMKSQIGVGTQMSIAMPVMQRPSKTQDTQISPIKRDSNNIRVLLIEDEISLCQVLTMFLDGQGYETTSATTYEDIRDKELYRTYYDLVISDVQLGTKSVMDVFELFKLHKNDSPFFIITGNLSAELKVEIEKIHAAGSMEKPFKSSEFLEEVRKSIAKIRENNLDMVG